MNNLPRLILLSVVGVTQVSISLVNFTQDRRFFSIYIFLLLTANIMLCFYSAKSEAQEDSTRKKLQISSRVTYLLIIEIIVLLITSLLSTDKIYSHLGLFIAGLYFIFYAINLGMHKFKSPN